MTDGLILPEGFASWEEVMALALEQARQAGDRSEVPVGAVVIAPDGRVLGRAGNSVIASNDPTAHAEIVALRQAAKIRSNYRLPDVLLAVTLEPCLMCLGAIIQARVAGLIFGAADPKAGAVVSRLRGLELDFLNHRLSCLGGVLAEPCSSLLSSFFQARRF